MSRGSEGYRGPELVDEKSVVVQDSDVFALGCILHELVMGQQLFHRDISVFEFMYSGEMPKHPVVDTDARSRAYICELRNSMLCLDWQCRPSARDILDEIGGTQTVEWRKRAAERSKRLEYPSECLDEWKEMKWRPFW